MYSGTCLQRSPWGHEMVAVIERGGLHTLNVELYTTDPLGHGCCREVTCISSLNCPLQTLWDMAVVERCPV